MELSNATLGTIISVVALLLIPAFRSLWQKGNEIEMLKAHNVTQDAAIAQLAADLKAKTEHIPERLARMEIVLFLVARKLDIPIPETPI